VNLLAFEELLMCPRQHVGTFSLLTQEKGSLRQTDQVLGGDSGFTICGR
jgi:hypothetical protein